MDDKTYQYMRERASAYEKKTKQINDGKRLLENIAKGYGIESYGQSIKVFLTTEREKEVKRLFCEIINKELELIKQEREEI